MEKVQTDDLRRTAETLRALGDATKLRPLCLCRSPGVPMYVARIGDQFVVKRMPLSGGRMIRNASPMNPLIN